MWPYVQINNLNQMQGPVTQVEHHLLFVGTAPSNTGKLLSLNTQSDFDKLLGEPASELKTNLQAAMANAGQNWTAAAFVLPTDMDWKDAVREAQKTQSFEGCVVLGQEWDEAKINAAHALNQELIAKLGFAFGRADRPFIRTVLGTGWPLPDIAPGEQLQQQRAEVFSRTDTVGNQSRHTDRRQHDKAMRMHREADEYLGEFGLHQLTTQQHSVEQIGAMKRIEALGAIELLAGDDMVLGSLGNMSQTTAGDLVSVIGQLRRSVAGELQHFEAPRSWVGTEGVNIFRLLLQLMNVVEQLAASAASHNHGGPGPTNAPAFSSQSQQAAELASTLSPIIE
ncbi:DUF2586 family protein [Aeromonas hydrophila]|uniref:DUF2586 family protein n=1 Tax=Aeromonas hydrophila TaxID=644 RepID=UPI0020B26618|nr:DUF2586 family protein [Aeromonas hydrophila]MCP3287261.1 DUF2586 domain-containing protein [Aeromonas hydrophila]